MITIGGLNIDAGGGALSQEVWSLADSFKHGVGVFDMSDMTWKNSYQANLTNYTTPKVIKSWYSSGLVTLTNIIQTVTDCFTEIWRKCIGRAMNLDSD